MRETSADIAIVGAGLIGLAIAFELAERGATVRLYDRAEPARAASWAGAGILAPHTESSSDPELLALCAASLADYPAFVERVRSASGVDPKLHLDGLLHVAFDDAQAAELSRRAGSLRAGGADCDLLDREQVLSCEPWLSHSVRAALMIRGEGQIDNRRFGRALAAACELRSVSLTHADTISVECDARRVLGVRSEVGFSPAGAVVNACGAWAAQLSGVPPSCVPPVEPVKGQMLALEMPVGFVRRTTWVRGAYLVPRDDGRLLIGATVERAGYDTRVTAEGINRLLDAALEAAPSLGAFSISETWAGLRPGTTDGRPRIGPTPVDGYFLATGHYRNGILLTPLTARLIADAIEGKEAQQVSRMSSV
jgi:glycine oxidase